MLESGLTPKDVVEQTGINKSSVYRIAQKSGVDLHGNCKIDERSFETLGLRIKAGKTRGQIAAEFGIREETARKLCHKLGAAFAGDYRDKDLEGNARDRIRDHNPQFEYLSGYTNYSSKVEVRCKTCGHVASVSYAHLTKHVYRCKQCEALRREEVRAERVADKKRRQEENKVKAQREREEKKRKAKEAKLAERLHACAVCGQMTGRPKYCSEVCANRAANKQHEMARRVKIKTAMVDKDITLEGVWRNDLGVCYICGGATDWNDKRVENGTIVCGDNYPSIDHVVPLSKGGEHSWTNCRLACRKCNSYKSDIAPASLKFKGWGKAATGGPLFPLRDGPNEKIRGGILWRRR